MNRECNTARKPSASGVRAGRSHRGADEPGSLLHGEAAEHMATWYKKLKETNNDTFLPLFFDRHRYLVLKGGGGSGKSIFAGRKVLERVTTEPGHRWLVCRKVQRTLRESCFKQLIGQLMDDYPDSGYKINKSDMLITFENGSEIIFAGLDDVEKLKSIYNITGIWIEEASELLESDFNQLDIRLRGETDFYKQIILTFNPVSILHWLKKRFFDFDISDPVLRKEAMERTRIHESTYQDNRFLDAEAIRTLEAFKGTDEYYYSVYCLGMWGVTGRSVFDAKAVTARLMEHIQPVRTGYFTYADDGIRLTDITWVDDPEGVIRIYKDPERGAPYVLGGDTAGGGSDSFVAQVIDNRTGVQVCTMRHQFDEDLYAKQCLCLGLHYNTALIGIETNYSTYPTMELERLRYPKLYVRESIDDYTHKVKQSYGFVTSTKTRPVILAGLIKAVREDIATVCDGDTLQEMLTFVRNEQYRPEAEAGAHDDCVMALAIAHYIRPQQSYLSAAVEGDTVQWTESQWEDYYAAGLEEKAYLLQKWGQPKK